MREWNDHVIGMSANCSAQPVVRQRRHYYCNVLLSSDLWMHCQIL